MPKVNPLTYEEVSKAVSYDPESGALTWLISPARNVKAGDPAGCAKGVRISKKTGLETRYIYVRINNFDTPAARVAWLLHHGEWPKGNLLFDDGDTTNLKISNLKEGVTYHITTGEDGIKSRKMSHETQRHYGLKRYYGISREEYNAKLDAQNGLCSICGNPETAVLNGRPKEMHVDHDHTTGKIRDLLCGMCNGMLGLARDNRDTLIKAARYLDRHSDAPKAVVDLKEVTQ